MIGLQSNVLRQPMLSSDWILVPPSDELHKDEASSLNSAVNISYTLSIYISKLYLAIPDLKQQIDCFLTCSDSAMPADKGQRQALANKLLETLTVKEAKIIKSFLLACAEKIIPSEANPIKQQIENNPVKKIQELSRIEICLCIAAIADNLILYKSIAKEHAYESKLALAFAITLDGNVYDYLQKNQESKTNPQLTNLALTAEFLGKSR